VSGCPELSFPSPLALLHGGGGMKDLITLKSMVEDIVSSYPQAIGYGIENGVSFISCAGSFPATLGDLLRVKGVSDPEAFVRGLNIYLAGIWDTHAAPRLGG